MRNLTDQQIEKIAEIDNLTALGLGTAAVGGGIYGAGKYVSPKAIGIASRDVSSALHGALAPRLSNVNNPSVQRAITRLGHMSRTGGRGGKKALRKHMARAGKFPGIGKGIAAAGGILTALGILT